MQVYHFTLHAYQSWRPIIPVCSGNAEWNFPHSMTRRHRSHGRKSVDRAQSTIAPQMQHRAGARRGGWVSFRLSEAMQDRLPAPSASPCWNCLLR